MRGSSYLRTKVIRMIFSEPKFLGCIDNQIFLPMELLFALRVISSNGMSSMSLKEWSRREKWSETAVGWQKWCGFLAFSMEHRCSANLSLSWLSLCIARYLYCTGYTPEQKMHLFLSFNLPSEVTDFPPFSYTLTIVKSLLYKRCPFRAESPSIGHLIGSTSGFKPFPPAFASILTLLGFLFKSRGLGKHH